MRVMWKLILKKRYETMRILDKTSGKLINSVVLMLTPLEAKELIDSIKSLNQSISDHVHVDDEDFKRDITVLIYTTENIMHFSKEIKEIILNDD